MNLANLLGLVVVMTIALIMSIAHDNGRLGRCFWFLVVGQCLGVVWAGFL